MLGCIFDSLDLIFWCILTSLCPFPSYLMGQCLCLAFPTSRVANFLHLHWGLGGVSVLENFQNVWLWNFMWGKCSVMEKFIVFSGAEEVMYLIILCWLYFCSTAIIFNSYLSVSYHLQMGRGNLWCHVWPTGPQSPCGWRYLRLIINLG